MKTYERFFLPLILLAAGFLLFSFFAPSLLEGKLRIECMTPFVAIAAAILTFLAFLIQHQANVQLSNDNKKQQLERQFYEMLKIHCDNVKKLHAESHVHIKDKVQYYSISGQDYLRLLLLEFNHIYTIIKNNDIISDKHLLFEKAYIVFFCGLDVARHLHTINDKVNEELCNFKSCSPNFFSYSNPKILPIYSTLFNGRVDQLSSYYRHLYLMVKTIVYADNTLFNYPEKRQYLRIVRAQLTSAEQVLLFYNWLARLGGEKWEEQDDPATSNGMEKNHFFTDYRMVHNINPKDCIAFDSNEILQELLKRKKKYQKLPQQDDLFEVIKE